MFVKIGTIEQETFRERLTVRLKNNEIFFEGDQALAERLRPGVVDADGRRVTLAEGEAFLYALSRIFDHPSLLATDVMQD